MDLDIRVDTQIYHFDEEVENDFAKANIVVNVVDESNLVIHINENKIFRSMTTRMAIIGAINKKLSELVEAHISKMAQNEQVLEDAK